MKLGPSSLTDTDRPELYGRRSSTVLTSIDDKLLGHRSQHATFICTVASRKEKFYSSFCLRILGRLLPISFYTVIHFLWTRVVGYFHSRISGVIFVCSCYFSVTDYPYVTCICILYAMSTPFSGTQVIASYKQSCEWLIPQASYNEGLTNI